MKVTTCLLLFTALHLSAATSAQQTKVSLEIKNASLEYLLKALEKESEMVFFYSVDDVAGVRNLNVRFKDKKVGEVLDMVLKGTGLQYEVSGNVIVLRKQEERAGRIPQQQMRTLTGQVTDRTGSPLPGVAVLVKGTTVGVSTNNEGRYRILVPDDKAVILLFSFVGMESKEVRLGDQKEINISLQEREESLQDVVVTGYAPFRKSSFTGNSIQVTGEELMKVSNRNIVDALQVFDPSLRLIPNNEMGSDPNTLPEFVIRGQSGIGNKELDQVDYRNNPNAPIFILDGFEVSLEKIYDLDMKRIADISILKDAAATAIYGSRAANGVVVLQTVTPKAGKLNVSYTFVASLTAPDLSDYNLMDAREKIETEEAAGFYDLDRVEGNSSKMNLEMERLRKWDRIHQGVDTYWLGLPLQNQFNHKHSIYFDGGNENIRVGLDLRLDYQGGVMKKSGRDRTGVGFYVGYQHKRLQIRNHISYDQVKSNTSPYGNFKDYAEKLPYDLYKDERGNYLKLLQTEYNNSGGWHASAGNLKNPLYEAKMVSNFARSKYYEITNNLSVNWYIQDDLYLRAQLALSRKNSTSEDFTDPLSGKYNSTTAYPGELSLGESKEVMINSNVFLNYIKNLELNYINVSFGFNLKEQKMQSSSSKFEGFPSGHLHSPQYAQKETYKTNFTDNHTRLFGTFLSINYSYNDIYLLDLSGRLDGSSEFGADKKSALFWSTGVGINVHKYAFMKQCEWLSQLKLKATYGKTGKINFKPYAAKTTYNIQNEWYDTGSGVLLTYYGNDKLKWEVTGKLNLGFNSSFFKDRITFDFNYYRDLTVDLVTDMTVPSSTGFTIYTDNMGEVSNTGIEMNFRAIAFRNKDLSLVFYGNLARNKNEILKISDNLKAYNEQIDELFSKYEANGPNKKDPTYARPYLKYTEGGSQNAIYGMKSLGINPADGQEIFERPDGTVSYTWFSADQQVLGNKDPKARGAFGINLNCKGFLLYTSFMYEFGGHIYNQTLSDKLEGVDLYNTNADRRVLYERWKKPGDVTKYKALQLNNEVTRPTSRFVQKNNTVKFNSLTLGYDVPETWLKKTEIGMLRAEFSMKDVANISNIKQERGLSYPFARTFDFSLNISF